MELDLVLDHQGLALGVNLLGEFGADGVVGSSILDNKTLVSLDALVDGGLFYRPLANIRPLLILASCVLLGV